MPEEIEVPTEHLHEAIHEEHHKATGAHHAGGGHHEAGGHAPGGGFTLGVALSSAILAVMAALSSLFAGHHANEAMLDRVEAGDRWAYYQAKGIKANVLKSKIETLAALDKAAGPKDEGKLAEYASDQKDIEKKARGLTDASEAHLDRHNTLATSVTFFQVAIALGAISVLTKKKPLWFLSLVVGTCGVLSMGKGFQPIDASFHEIEEQAAKESGSEGAEAPEKAEPSPARDHAAKGEAPEHPNKAEAEHHPEREAK